jgi:hypothetical protein
MSRYNASNQNKPGMLLYRITNLTMNGAALALMLLGGLWLKNNFPSKDDFTEMQEKMKSDLKDLQTRLNSVDRSVLQLGETAKRIEDFETRIRILERSTTGRVPIKPIP